MGNAQESSCFLAAWQRDIEEVQQPKELAQLFSIPFKDSEKKEQTLGEYMGDNKCMLIVNVASK